MTPHVLLVGDQPALSATLDSAGYRVTVASDPGDAVGRVQAVSPDVVVLDLRRPGCDGGRLVQAIRRESDAALVLLSARDRETETFAALEAGADDYIDAPFDSDELITRIRVAQRRRLHRPAGPPAGFAGGGLTIDYGSRRVTVGDRQVRLSPKEYALLRLLAQRAGQVVDHRALLTAGWGRTTDTHYLRVYIGMLRQKIEEDPAAPRLIVTEPGIGYRLAVG